MSLVWTSGARRAAVGGKSNAISAGASAGTSHNTVYILAGAIGAGVPMPHCFFIEQWCALQHDGIALPAASTFAHASAIMQIKTTDAIRRTF